MHRGIAEEKKATGRGEGRHRGPLAKKQQAVTRGLHDSPLRRGQRSQRRDGALGRWERGGGTRGNREGGNGNESHFREFAGGTECRLRVAIAFNVPKFAVANSATYESFAFSFVSRPRTLFQKWIANLTRLGTRTGFRDRRESS